MASTRKNKGFLASMSSGISMFRRSAMHRSVNGFLGHEGVEVINPEGGKDDAEEEAQGRRLKKEERDSFRKMMLKYIGSDFTSLVTLPIHIFEPMTMLQKLAELMEYSHLLDRADECGTLTCVWYMLPHGLYLCTMPTSEPGSLLILFSGRLMKWLTMVGLHFLQNRTRVTLKRDVVVLDLVPPRTKVNNLIFGRTWVNSLGEMIMTILSTGDKALLYFQPCGWFGAGRYEVDGYVYNAAEEPKLLMTGKWNESMDY